MKKDHAMKYVRKLLEDAAKDGLKFRVNCYGETDYSGTDTTKALEAITSVDAAELQLVYPDGKIASSFYIVQDPYAAPEEAIADFAGAWANHWWEMNSNTL